MHKAPSDPSAASPLKRALKAVTDMSARLAALEREAREPIAVIGMGLRFPGGVATPEDFWTLLRQGREGVVEIPPERWAVEAYYDPDPQAAGKMVTRRGGIVEGIDLFEPQFFGISAREALGMDPQQRLLLETTWEALERAGQDPLKLAGSPTGVFIGLGASDYANLAGLSQGPAHIDAYSGTGIAFSVAAGRIAYTLGLQGPTLTVDTACSSSLVAVHLACQNLRSRRCRMALAGGANLILAPETNIYLSRVQAIAPDGRCKTFDADADGYGRGDGCAVIVLKRLADALADGSPVLALLMGSAVNHDGRTSGLTVPSGRAQQAVIREALQEARLEPPQIGYVEAHGTGTPLGDPIELEALARVFGEGRDGANPLLVGSVKTNLGHLEAAAGIAGLIKVILSLQQGAIPPHLNVRRLTPRFDWEAHPLRVPLATTPWPAGDTPRRAGVSSFGFSGTNAHLIVQEAPPPGGNDSAAGPVPLERPLHLVTLAARQPEALAAAVRRWDRHLEGADEALLPHVGHTANCGRAHFDERLALVADSLPRLRQMLQAHAAGRVLPGMFAGAADRREHPKVAWLFTGQGSQVVGMGRGLYETQPVFRRTLERCQAVLEGELERPLLSVLYPAAGGEAEAQALLDQTGYAQPALFAVAAGLVEVWRSWGLGPSAVLGHSVGEYVAAWVAGVFGLEEGLRLTAARGRLMQGLPSGGAMAAVMASAEVVGEVVAGFGGAVSLAALNGPANTVVSGVSEAVAGVREALGRRGVASVPLKVSHAFHSALMEPMLEAFEDRAARVPHQDPRIPLVGNLSGAPLGPQEIGAGYWRRHARAPVRFQEGMQALAREGCRIFLEVGPHAVLTGMARRFMASEKALWLSSLDRAGDDWRPMLHSLAQLYCQGLEVDWEGFDAGYARRIVPLPTYPFQRRRYWAVREPSAAPAVEAGPPRRAAEERLPGRRIPVALEARIFQTRLGAGTPIALEDHRIYQRIVVPGAFHLAWLLAAADASGAGAPLALTDITFPQAAVLEAGEERLAQAVLKPTGGPEMLFEVASRDPAAEADTVWMRHAEGRLVGGQGLPQEAALPTLRLEEIRSRCRPSAYAETFYTQVRELGLTLGPSFQCLGEVWRRDGEALARMRPPADQTPPAWLAAGLIDACFQLIGAALPAGLAAEAVYVPVGLQRFDFRGRRGTGMWCHAALRPGDGPGREVLEADIVLVDDGGEAVARMERLALKRAPREALLGGAAPSLAGWRYGLQWRPRPASPNEPPGDAAGRWLVCADAAGLGEALASRLARRGGACVLAFPGPTFQAEGSGRFRLDPADPDQIRRLLLEAAPHGGPWRGILHLWSLPDPGDRPRDAAGLDRSLRRGCGTALELLKLLEGIAEAPPRLWLFTCGGQAAGGDGPPPAPEQAALWGLGRVAALEQPRCWGGLVDLDPAGGPTDLDLVLPVLLAPGEEDQLALRGGELRAARLARERGGPRAAGPKAFDPQASYLITGGLGALGRVVAAWMAARGARHLVLAGRRPPGAEARAAIAALEAAGAQVRVRQADLSREADTAALLAAIAAEGPPLKGIVHAAGVLDDRVLQQLDWERFARVLAPKALGAWHLDRLTRELPLEFFVLFSSAAALLGNPGQGNYAAANAFLDALAHRRQAEGRPGLSVGWGAWGEAGMAQGLAEVDRRRLASRGVALIAPPDGVRMLEELLQEEAPPAQVAVLPLDWDALLRSSPQAAGRPLLRAVLAAERPDARRGLDRSGLAAAPEAERRQRLEDYLAALVAEELLIPVPELDRQAALPRLGFDSLMAVRVKNRVEAELRVVMPIVGFLEDQSVHTLGGRLALALAEEGGESGGPGRDRAAAAAPAPGGELDPDAALDPQQALELLGRMDTLSEAQIEAMLRRVAAEKEEPAGE